MKRRAFTLVELLVVIAIIGLLSTVALVTTNSARIKSRNTKRAADMRQLLSVMQFIHDSNGGFPASGASANTWACVSKDCREGWAGFAAYAPLDSLISTYMAAKPDDPNGGIRGYAGYLYNGGFPGATGPSGNVFPAAPTLNFLLELPATSCPIGNLWSTTGTYTQCYLTLN